CPQSKYKKLVLSKVATNEGKHQDHDQKREQVVMMDQTRRKRPQRHSPKPVHQPKNHSTRVEFPRRDLERQDGCTSTPKVAGVMSPATPYRNTRQDKQKQGKTAQQDKLKDARDTI
ncbi:unnamed protein product, partial [Porites lobata]